MSRALLGAAAGAGGATLVLKPEVLQDWTKELVWGPNPYKAGPLPAGKELEHLQRLVEDLSRQVAASKQGGVTVVHTGSSSAGSYVFYTAAAAGLGVVVYLRVLRGWTFGDMLYATRRGLRDGLAQVTTGLHELGARVSEVKERLQARIAQLMQKQNEMLRAQDEMRGHLSAVGQDVEHTRGQVGQIHAVVLDLEAGMAEVGANQRHANQGIYVLCKAVSELMAGHSIPSKAELVEFTQQHPVWAAAQAAEQRLQGLESLLASPAGAQPGLRRSASARRADENASPTRGPFLLGGSPGSPPQRKALAESVAARSGVFAGLSAAVGAAAAGGTLPDSVTFPPPHQRSVSVGGGAGGGGAFDGAW